MLSYTLFSTSQVVPALFAMNSAHAGGLMHAFDLVQFLCFEH